MSKHPQSRAKEIVYGGLTGLSALAALGLGGVGIYAHTHPDEAGLKNKTEVYRSDRNYAKTAGFLIGLTALAGGAAGRAHRLRTGRRMEFTAGDSHVAIELPKGTSARDVDTEAFANVLRATRSASDAPAARDLPIDVIQPSNERSGRNDSGVPATGQPDNEFVVEAQPVQDPHRLR